MAVGSRLLYEDAKQDRPQGAGPATGEAAAGSGRKSIKNMTRDEYNATFGSVAKLGGKP